jgi:arylsulfatase A-like enzyme
VAAPALGVRHEEGRLRPSATLSDGVTLAVEVHADSPLDGSPDGPVRVWETTLAPADTWVDAEVDLSAYVGRSFELQLVTTGGPAGDTTCDYVLWGGLRLRGGARRAPERPHVILVDIDTLRADRLGLYGSRNDTSPRIDAWAEREGIVFDEARATSGWTLPATASMLTGLTVTQHGATRIGENLSAAHGSLASRLAAVGYETWARTDGGVVVPENGFAEGFDVFDHDTEAASVAQSLDELAKAVRTRRSERPLFLFVQSYAVHTPYEQDRRFVTGDPPSAGPLTEQPVTEPLVAEWLRGRSGTPDASEAAYVSALYDAAVARMDAAFGPFLEGLEAALGGQPFLVVLTSDHGEELLERGALGHGHSLHRELLHVPLVLRLPAGPRGLRVDDPVSALDLLPTLLAQLGLPVPPDLPGRVLLDGEHPVVPLVARHRDAGWAIEWNRTKLLTGPIGREPLGVRNRGALGSPLGSGHPVTLALYDLARDPLERTNVAASEPDRAERLLERLERWRAQHPPVLAGGEGAPPLSIEQLEQLEQLGYVEGG